jgi:hypothetical protein
MHLLGAASIGRDMSDQDQNESKNEGRQPHQSDDGDTKENKAKSLLAEVANRVKGTNDIVQETYITKLVQKEVEQRVDLLDKAMQKRFTCLTELNKINRPDVETFDADGKLASGTYTKDRLKAIKDAKENLAKVENAIDKALAGDWSKVKELK